MKQIIRANTRGKANISWLEGYHSFSFGHYYDEYRMGFGPLRVLNDDIIQPGFGFPTHPHDNMEIITIILDGELSHQDSMGTKETLKPGDIQIMSAGSGVTHSEINDSDSPTSLLQIWLEPKKENIPPSYTNKSYTDDIITDTLFPIVTSDDICQDATMYLTKTDKPITVKKAHWYVFVIDGELTVDSTTLGKRDAIQTDEKLTLTPTKESFVLLFEV